MTTPLIQRKMRKQKQMLKQKQTEMRHQKGMPKMYLPHHPQQQQQPPHPSEASKGSTCPFSLP